MRTIYVKYYDPMEIFPGEIVSKLLDKQIIKDCFKAFKCQNETHALMVYAETPCTWSTLLDDSMTEEDVQKWIEEAYEHIKSNDYDWLEENFT